MSYDRAKSGWAVGWTGFAAVWMWVLGFFHMLAGISGIVEDEVLVATPGYVFGLDLTTWGWIHLLVGALVLVAGVSVLSGSVWARTVGVMLAVLSTLSTFAWLPYQPGWAVLIIAANAFVIWALTVHGDDIAYA